MVILMSNINWSLTMYSLLNYFIKIYTYKWENYTGQFYTSFNTC